MQDTFTPLLLQWAKTIQRDMPWKGEKNPYLIWLSEIILQQTRVEQGTAYFLKFKANYPTVKDLANAPQDEVLKLWEGLGYYSRARNLHFTAKYIANELDGVFPSDYKSILALKGVGTYTAAAIASFAYDLPHAVVDGNVYRVLSRVFGIRTPIDSTVGKKEFAALAQELLSNDQAAVYNQAIMDFGAIQCVPKMPNCQICPMHKKCIAYQEDLISELPVKEKKTKKRTRYFNYLVIEQGENTFIEKRVEKDIWQDLYQFPMIEKTDIVEQAVLESSAEWKSIFIHNTATIVAVSTIYKQQLSHQKIIARFWEIQLSNTENLNPQNIIKVKQEDLRTFAFPKIIDTYLNDTNSQGLLF